MKSKSVRKLAALSAVLATLFLTGCGQSEQAREAARLQAIAEGLDTANRLLFSGQTDQAIARLEILDGENPNSPEILEALAFAYAKKPDHALAAFYFDSVVQNDPSRADLALYAARSHSETGDTAAAARAYTIYLVEEPEDAAAWRALAEAQTAERQTKPALDAWLQTLRLSGGQPGASDAATIGQLYLTLENVPQAKRWLELSLQSPAQGDSRQRALLGLLEIDLREKQWAAAEKRLAELDKAAPGALDASPLASARLELKKWREAQAELEKQRLATLAQAEADKKKAEETARLAQNENTANTPTGSITVDRTGETISLADGSATPPPQGKSLPGIPPAHAQEQGLTPTLNLAQANAHNGGEIPPSPLADSSSWQPATTADDAPSAPPPVAPATLTERADLAYEAGNYAEAIKLYQSALAAEPNAAPVYYGLSRAYYQQQQWPQAELYASEAMRLSPDNLRYNINFLRSIQRTQSAQRLMAEMVRSKERFPDSPDVTLALARGYERLQNNRRNAVYLYQEFLRLAPGHPQAEEIRQHLDSMR